MSTLRRIASRIDDGLDLARMHLRRLTGHDDPVTLQIHRGFGNAERLYVAGTVVTGEEAATSRRRIRLLADIEATIGRYIERGVMGARLTVRHGDAEASAISDSDGFFEAELPAPPLGTHAVEWLTVDVTLESVPGGNEPPSTCQGEVMLPPAGADFGIISDMDDTVLKTGIHDLRRNWRQVIASDPALREAFPGLPELYQALTHDRDGVQRRPMFYVSSAAWGFYDLFCEFLRLREVPMGPLLLKNYGLDDEKWFAGGHSGHKSAAIERLFGVYPEMSFVLVGDSGQHDAAIYRDVVANHPGRVAAVWIRDVDPAETRRAEVRGLIREVEESGVPAAFGPDLLVAARQAASFGWIPDEAIGWVEQAVESCAASG